jgi:gluconate 5-dehydrogenase
MISTAAMFRLDGQTAIVSGGASGLGLGITRCLADAGAAVAVIGSRSPEKAAEALKEFAGGVRYFQFDITDTDNTQSLADRIAGEMGDVSILINNAGNHCKKNIEDMSIKDFTGVLDVHLVGAFALTKAVIPSMKKRRKGSVIFQASMTSYIGMPMVCGYAAAKAGYLGLIHTLASECGPFNVRVNAIAPGWIDTPMFHRATDNDPQRLAKIMGRIPMKKIGGVNDIGMAALFLCGEGAAYINGVCLPVDGGGLIGF